MDSLIDSVGTLRVRVQTDPETAQALDELVRIALRQERALRFYANLGNYIDGVPMLEHPDDGLLTLEDNGFTAQRALGENLALGLVVLPAAA